MITGKHITVFEHERLLFGDHRRFKEHHWNALARFNEANYQKYFTLLHNGIKLRQYVGVFQVGDLTIEVLPKIDKNEQDEKKWQAILLEMLLECSWMQVDINNPAPLKLKHNSILEAYLEVFLSCCEKLLHQGLVKRYRLEEENTPALKGKLLFCKHLRANHIHKERFFVSRAVYNTDNIYNHILYEAIKLVSKISRAPLLADKTGRLLLSWPQTKGIVVSEHTFARLNFNRKTDHYREALLIAKMILLNYRPDIQSGSNHVLAVMFDMNKLWEEFIYRRLLREVPNGITEAKRQRKRIFWESESFPKNVQPDIVVKDQSGTLVLDTKWKTYDNLKAVDEELKQMYVYSGLWGARRTVILAPFNAPGVNVRSIGHFHKPHQGKTIKGDVCCAWMGISILSGDNAGKNLLSKNIGSQIIAKLKTIGHPAENKKNSGNGPGD